MPDNYNNFCYILGGEIQWIVPKDNEMLAHLLELKK